MKAVEQKVIEHSIEGKEIKTIKVDFTHSINSYRAPAIGQEPLQSWCPMLVKNSYQFWSHVVCWKIILALRKCAQERVTQQVLVLKPCMLFFF